MSRRRGRSSCHFLRMLSASESECCPRLVSSRRPSSFFFVLFTVLLLSLFYFIFFTYTNALRQRDLRKKLDSASRTWRARSR
jgi:hypothetical protein